MNNLLIGGSGFIGSALAAELIGQGENVTSVSLRGDDRVVGVKSISVDLYQHNCPQEILAAADSIYILIGQTHAGFDSDIENKALARLAESLKTGQQKVFYFSTSKVYGETPKPASEQTKCQPIDEYAKFKLEAESVMSDHIDPNRLTILRLANVYGSPKNKGFIGLLVDKIIQSDLNITLSGDGQQRRDYLFIDDLILSVLAVRDAYESSGCVNIATGTTYSLIEIVELASEVSNCKIEYSFNPELDDKPQNILLNNTRLKEFYNYPNFTSLKDGLKEALHRAKENKA